MTAARPDRAGRRIGPSPDASDTLSGGTYGLEASAIGTVVLIAATGAALWLFRRTPDPADRPVDQPQVSTT